MRRMVSGSGRPRGTEPGASSYRRLASAATGGRWAYENDTLSTADECIIGAALGTIAGLGHDQASMRRPGDRSQEFASLSEQRIGPAPSIAPSGRTRKEAT